MNSPKPEQQTEASLCSGCVKFYGNAAFGGLCSGCYKQKGATVKAETPITDKLSETKEEIKSETGEEKKQELGPVQKDRKRCFQCNKKVGLLGNECKCSFVFCNAHRLPEDHKCGFDFRKKGEQQLIKKVVGAKHEKIQKI